MTLFSLLSGPRCLEERVGESLHQCTRGAHARPANDFHRLHRGPWKAWGAGSLDRWREPQQFQCTRRVRAADINTQSHRPSTCRPSFLSHLTPGQVKRGLMQMESPKACPRSTEASRSSCHTDGMTVPPCSGTKYASLGHQDSWRLCIISSTHPLSTSHLLFPSPGNRPTSSFTLGVGGQLSGRHLPEPPQPNPSCSINTQPDLLPVPPVPRLSPPPLQL